MAFTIGKRMIAFPAVPRQEGGAVSGPFITGPTAPKVGTFLTYNTGAPWVGHPPFNSKFQWYSNGTLVANATNQSFSPQSAGGFLTCRMSQGNPKWGTVFKDATIGTIQP